MLRHVAPAQTFIEAAIVGIHVAPGRAVFIRRFYVVNELRKRVVGEKGKAAAQTFFRANETCVVCRVADGWIDPDHITELGEGTQALRVTRAQKLGWDLIECEVVGSEMMAHVADVTGFNQHTAADFVLHIQVVLIRNRRYLIRIEVRNSSVRRLAKWHCAKGRRQSWTSIGRKTACKRKHDLRSSLRGRVRGGSRKAERGDVADRVAD